MGVGLPHGALRGVLFATSAIAFSSTPARTPRCRAGTVLRSKPLSQLETAAEFDAAVTKHARVAILITAPWCRACKRVVPRFQRLSDSFDGVAFHEVSHSSLDDIKASTLIRARAASLTLRVETVVPP